MNILERALAAAAPRWAASRARHRAVLAHYEAASFGRSNAALRASRSDADAAARGRSRMAWFSRDLVRNTPFATRAQQVIAGNVVGDGILPKIAVRSDGLDARAVRLIRERGLRRIEQHLDGVRIDRLRRQNLYGLQRLVISAVVDAGECLVRYHGADEGDGFSLELEVLESDYLDTDKVGFLSDGSEIRDGIEYDAEDRRVAYWLFPKHPGADWSPSQRPGLSERVPVSQVLHIYRQDRPGQQRGVTWFAPIMRKLQQLDEHEDAQLMRRKVAACFAAFRVLGEGDKEADFPKTIMPGMIYDLHGEEDVKFSAPPGVEAYDEFTRSILRSSAAGLGISYEALTGDLAQVNFSSARMGRLEMDQNVSAWQWLMLVPQLLLPIGARFLEDWQAADFDEFRRAGLPEDVWDRISLTWVPPRRVIVDPAREFAALREAVRSGFASRQQVVRQLGIDPERLLEEQFQDKAEADRLGLPFDSDPRADVSRQARTDDPGDTTAMLNDLSRALGVSTDEIAGLVADLRARENRSSAR